MARSGPRRAPSTASRPCTSHGSSRALAARNPDVAARSIRATGRSVRTRSPATTRGRVGSADRGTVAVATDGEQRAVRPPLVPCRDHPGPTGLRIHQVQRVDEPLLLDLPDRRRRHGVGVEFDDTAAGARRPAGRLALPRAPPATPTKRSSPGRSGRARPPRSTRCDAAAAAAPAADRPGRRRTPHGATPAPGAGAPRRGRPPPPRRPRCPRRARPPPSRRSARRSDPVRRSTPPAAARGRTAR